MPHEFLCVFHIGFGLLQPCCVRCPQATPVHKVQPELPGCWLDVPLQNVVVTHSGTSRYGLKHKIVRAVALHDLVVPCCTTCPYIDCHCLQSVDAFDHGLVDRDRIVACIALRRSPI